MTEIISFTDNGEKLGERLSSLLEDSHAQRCPKNGLRELVKNIWNSHPDFIIFISACQIAVRAIAPHLVKKDVDPAVIVIDEKATFTIPILSGHIGQGILMTRKVSSLLNSIPVITTATDVNGLFSIDAWASVNHLKVKDTNRIKDAAGRILKHQEMRIRSDFPIEGKVPEYVALTDGDDYHCIITPYVTDGRFLHLVPRNMVLGIGCRKGTPKEDIEKAFETLNLEGCSISDVCSHDIKKDEKGLLEFAESLGAETHFYTSDELNALDGDFPFSEFVYRTTGCGNVCQRSCMMISDTLVMEKKCYGNVTFSIGMKNIELKF